MATKYGHWFINMDTFAIVSNSHTLVKGWNDWNQKRNSLNSPIADSVPTYRKPPLLWFSTFVYIFSVTHIFSHSGKNVCQLFSFPSFSETSTAVILQVVGTAIYVSSQIHCLFIHSHNLS